MFKYERITQTHTDTHKHTHKHTHIHDPMCKFIFPLHPPRRIWITARVQKLQKKMLRDDNKNNSIINFERKPTPQHIKYTFYYYIIIITLSVYCVPSSFCGTIKSFYNKNKRKKITHLTEYQKKRRKKRKKRRLNRAFRIYFNSFILIDMVHNSFIQWFIYTRTWEMVQFNIHIHLRI